MKQTTTEFELAHVQARLAILESAICGIAIAIPGLAELLRQGLAALEPEFRQMGLSDDAFTLNEKLAHIK